MSTIVRQADDRHTIRPPQFGLRTMFIAVAILCAILAIASAVGAVVSAALLMLASLIAAHVIGNAVGTRLRDRDRFTPVEDPLSPQLAHTPPPCEPARQLQENSAINRRWLIAAGLGAIIGGTIGGITISIDVGAKLTLAGLCLGVGSSAVLGGFAAFMAISLWSVARSAIGEAVATHYDSIQELPRPSNDPPHCEG